MANSAITLVPVCTAPCQLSFPDFQIYLSPRIMGRVLDACDSERDLRSGDEWLLSVISYCEWRAGTSWRKLHRSGQRDNETRWYYKHAVRLLLTLRYSPEPGDATAAELQYILDGAKLPPRKPASRHLPSLKQIEMMKAAL
jgi:hypothetical protein